MGRIRPFRARSSTYTLRLIHRVLNSRIKITLKLNGVQLAIPSVIDSFLWPSGPLRGLPSPNTDPSGVLWKTVNPSTNDGITVSPTGEQVPGLVLGRSQPWVVSHENRQ